MNRLSSFKEKSIYNKVRSDLNRFDIFLKKNDINISVYYSTLESEEIYFDELFYYSNSDEETLGLLEAYFTLAQKKPVEGVDRITIKEFDYFLRVENSIPSFSYYSGELYEILSIGEELRQFILPKNKNHSLILDVEQDGTFTDLSYSEQLDFIEEYLAAFVYTEKRFESIKFDFEVSDRIEVIVSPRGGISKEDQLYLREGLIRELQLADMEIIFI